MWLHVRASACWRKWSLLWEVKYLHAASANQSIIIIHAKWCSISILYEREWVNACVMRMYFSVCEGYGIMVWIHVCTRVRRGYMGLCERGSVCVYEYVCMFDVCVGVRYVRAWILCTCMNCMCMHKWVYACAGVWVDVYMWVNMCVRVYLSICIFVCMRSRFHCIISSVNDNSLMYRKLL